MSVFQVGLNPYGLAYTVGLQGTGTPRANPNGVGLEGFVEIAHELGARCIEIHESWVDPRTTSRSTLRTDLPTILSTGLTHQPGETLDAAIHKAKAVGAVLIRLGLSPVLEGSRAKWGAQFHHFASHARTVLHAAAPRAADAGLTIAIEDHQDFGSEELVAMAEAAGDNVGVVMDTGNPFAVGEDPVAFARRAAPRIRHVHLKDYRAQFTNEGYKLVRCAIGDGAVPFAEIADILAQHHSSLTASLEPGALDARHIRAFTPDWWEGYPPRDAREFGTALGRLRGCRIGDDEDGRTPWERGVTGEELIAFELAQIRRSAENMRALGWR